jgi:hypothetical protein
MDFQSTALPAELPRHTLGKSKLAALISTDNDYYNKIGGVSKAGLILTGCPGGLQSLLLFEAGA